MSQDVYMKIKENEGIIYKLAHRYSNYYNIEDLYQAGCMGIIKANKCYKKESSTKFSTYAYKYILGEIIDFIRKDKNIIVSDEIYELYKKYLKAKELLSNKYNREINFTEICKYMNVDEKNMLNIIESVSFAKSIESDELLLNSHYIDERDIIDYEILLKSEINNLDKEDKDLINYRYYQGYSQSETALKMGISQVKVSRCEKQILSKIKRNIAI